MQGETATVPVSRARDLSGNDSFCGSTLAWYGLAVLLMTTLHALMVRQMLNLIAPSLQSSLHISDMQIGILQGLGMAIFACIASFPMGWLADKFGRRLVLATGVCVWSLATFLCAFQHSFGGLFVSTVGIAVGEAGLAPIVYAMIPDLFPERKRNTANLIFYAGFMLGAGIGMALGGAVLQWLASSPHSLPEWLSHVDSWRIAMAILAIPSPLFFILIMRMPVAGRQPRTRHTRSNRNLNDTTLDFLPYAKTHWRTLICVFGSIFAMAVAMASGLTWFPIALPRAFGIDPAAVGVGLGTAITVATLAGVVLPGIALRLGHYAGGIQPIRVASFFVWMTPIPAAFLPFTTSPFQAYVVAALQATTGIAGSALMPGIIQGLAPEHLRSRVLALLGIVNALALAISPLAIGLISGVLTGPRGMLYSITVVSVPSLIAAAILISLAGRPYAVAARAIRLQNSGEEI